MKLLLSSVALLSAGCVATIVPVQEVPRRLVLTAGEALPADLHADSTPEVVVLLLITGDNRSEVVESAVEDLNAAMQARGFHLVGPLPLDCVGAYMIRFFGGSCDVLGTNQIQVICLASQILFEALIPFDWGLSQSFYLSVPSAYAKDARARLRADGRVPASSILEEGD